ncbi:MAG: hypothetical protein RR246_02455 [Clostridia bacterium]
MKNKKKITALLLCVLMLSMSFLVACNDASSDVSQTKSSETQSNNLSNTESSETSDSEWTEGIVGYLGSGKWGRKMPEFKWKDKQTFTVLVTSSDGDATYYSEDVEPNLYPDTTDATLNDAVIRRNNEIEKKYGVKIKAQTCKNVYTTLTQQLTSGKLEPDNADAAMPFLPSCTTLAQNHQLYELHEFEKDGYLDLSMPWWEANANESFSIAGKTYFAIGDMTIMQKIVSFCVMFNKDLLATKHKEINLYDEVKNNKWTLDRMITLGKEFTYESGGDSEKRTMEDNWGLSSSYNDSLMLYLASGSRLISKDAQDIPILSVGIDERSVKITQKILSILQEKNTFAIHAQDLGDDKWVKSLDIFGEGRALFRTSAFSAVKKVRNYQDCNFGIIPLPLIDDTQEEYYTPCSALYAYGTVIPLSAPEPEFSAFMLDAISAESRGNTPTGITRAYTEIVLKGKDLDTDSGEMLDKYIFNNIIYDLGIIYEKFAVSGIFTTLMSTASKDIASSIAEAADSIKSEIDSVVENYKK